MPSFIKIWIHLIWSTKDREKLIHKDIKYRLYDHIKTNSKSKNIYIDHINGTDNHVHLLISLKGEQSISQVAFLLKGESSHWINVNKLTRTKFEWQNEFIALSVSESSLPKVREYIRNQEIHHKNKSFKEEYEIFIKKYGFNRFKAKAE
ncbi:MAG: IS200/IS605 family transposase [Candidatus Thorarchaeota archaeon]